MKTFTWGVITSLLFMLHPFKTISQDITNNGEQVKLMQGWVGTWQQKVDKDTAEVWKLKAYGNSFTADLFFEIKGKKKHLLKDNFTYSEKEGKFKGFRLYFNGKYDTWMGSFVSDKKFSIEMTRDFSPVSTSDKYEIVMDTPSGFTVTRFENGLKIKEYRYKKVK